jgi:deoxyhypusine synthase
MGIPIYTPGWEDSTFGNVVAGFLHCGEIGNINWLKGGVEQFSELMSWYLDRTMDEVCENVTGSVGFFQVGGGIAGDYAICAVPTIRQDLEIDAPHWGYFCQISDAVTSYGGYSGAPPNEKITWDKLDRGTINYMIQSDATIVAPLIFAYVMGL